jgi:hypothetical protein
MRSPSDEKNPVERAGVLLVLTVMLAPFALLGWAFWRSHSLAEGFDKVTIGATQEQEEVVRLMGKPKKTLKCGEFFGPIPKEESEGCAKEFLYPSPFAPVLPQYYVARFDANNHVKSTYPYSSP